jgi:hypothetical protein
MKPGERVVFEGKTLTVKRVVYYTLILPWVGGWKSPRNTEWHPTDPDFAPLSRGSFASKRKARAWAKDKGVRGYAIRRIEYLDAR